VEWLDSHSGGVQAIATGVLVFLTAYYAWTTRALVHETRTTLKAAARATLQSRLDRISELCIQNPRLFTSLDQEMLEGEDQDGRFHLSSMFLGVLEEAFTQFSLERSMSPDDWSAWQATIDVFLPKPYVTQYWQRSQHTFEPSFRRFVNERLGGRR